MRDRKTVKDTWNAPTYFLIVVFISFFVIAIQLSYVALSPSVYGINMDEFAASRNTYSSTLYAKRGTFYDSEGNVLAQDVASYTVIAYLSETRTKNLTNPQHVIAKEATAKALAPILNMTEERLLELLSKDLYQVELGPGGRGITELVKEEIESLNLPGIDFIETFKRFYPNGNFASYVIGYAKKYEKLDENGKTFEKIIGELGLESKYNELLTGENGYLKYQQDRFGYKIPDTKEEKVEAINGSDVYLTLDSNIQRFAESAIKDIEETYSPKWATIAVMNAKNGDILAASTIPSFDPNIKNISNYQSPLVTYKFEPGSTMKIYAYLCAIDSGKYDGNYRLKSGSITIGDDEVRDWNRTGWGHITLDQGLLYSSNVAASTLVQKVINKSELRECLEKFGFGDVTGIELAHEAAGDVGFTYPIEVATATFGQGITTTVMQQLQGMSILANDGKMVKPHIVDKIIDPNTDEIIYESVTEKTEKLVKTSSVEYINNLLYQAVNGDDYNATGLYYKLDGYDVLGKTGTAQIAAPTGGYLEGPNDYINSFVGMYPKNNPEIIIYVAVQQPTWGANQPVVNATKEMIVNITKYLNLFDDGTNKSEVETYKLESYISKNTNVIKEKLESKKIEVITIGNGEKIINQYPKKGTNVLSYDKVFLITNDSEIKLPNFVGYSKKEAENLLNLLNIRYNINGNGYVVSQDIEAGILVTNDLTIKLELQDKYNLDTN